MKYEIDEEVLLELIYYLSARPYDEVMPLIAKLTMTLHSKQPVKTPKDKEQHE